MVKSSICAGETGVIRWGLSLLSCLTSSEIDWLLSVIHIGDDLRCSWVVGMLLKVCCQSCFVVGLSAALRVLERCCTGASLDPATKRTL